jgi:phasin family protein
MELLHMAEAESLGSEASGADAVGKPKATKRAVKAVPAPAPAVAATAAIVASPSATAVSVPVNEMPASPAPPAPVVPPPPMVAETPPLPAAAPTAPPPVAQQKEQVMQNEAITKSIETVVPAMEKAASDAVAQAQAGVEQMNVKMREMMEKSMSTMTEMTEFAKGNVEAMIESAKAAAAGAETLAAHFAETSKKSVEEAQAAFKTMTTAKTPNELMAAQNDFAKAQFDKAVANMSHFSETWMKLAGDVVQPLSNRVALATETVKKSMTV